MEVFVSLGNGGESSVAFVPGSRVYGIVAVSGRRGGSAVGVRNLDVQVAGVLAADPKWVKLPQAASVTQATLIPLQPHERIIFASPPMPLLKVWFSAKLPKSLPPSFRGNALRYSYCVVVSALQEGEKTPQVSCIPFRVVSPDGKWSSHRPAEVPFDFDALPGDDPDTTSAPSAIGVRGAPRASLPPAIVTSSMTDVRVAFAPVVSMLERMSHPVCVNVTDRGRHLVRVALRSAAFCPGDNISGLCDFTGSDFLCHSVSVSLEAEETLDLAVCWSQRSKRPSPRVIAEAHAVTSCMDVAPFSLPLPHDACHEFSSSEVSLKWMLVFVFRVVPDGATPSAVLSDPRLVSFAHPISVLVTSLPAEPCKLQSPICRFF